MRLIRYSVLLLALVLSVGIVFAQEAGDETRLADTYLHGGEFDSYTGFVTFWTLLDAAPKDARVCGKVGYNGSNCAFQFFGNKTGEKTRLKQTTRPDFRYGSSEPHYGFLIARVKPLKGENIVRFSFTFTFKDGSEPVKTMYEYVGTGPFEEYETIYIETEQSFNPNNIESSRVLVRNFSPFRSSILVDSMTIGMNIVPPPTR